jgi:hypothetical protein
MPRLISLKPEFHWFADAVWSEPVHLDAPINSPSRELGAALSDDELSLYFGSDRPGGLGGIDIWVSHRACRECPWGEPANLGPNINSALGDGGPALSRDGHQLFFSGARAGGEGGEDIWVSYREDVSDDLGWGPAVNLGPNVNTAAPEQSPSLYVRAVGEGEVELVFTRAGVGFFQARLTRQGEVLEPAVAVAELNGPGAATGDDLSDGKDELLSSRRRASGSEARDIWVARRRNANEPWSAPQNVGATINTIGADLTPSLSTDGRTLFFAAGANARPTLGLQDIWMSTRAPQESSRH